MPVSAVFWVHYCARCQFINVNTTIEIPCPFCKGATTSRAARL